MSNYRLLTYDRDGVPVGGLLIDNLVYPVDELSGLSDMGNASVLSLLERWDEAEPVLRAAAAAPERASATPLTCVKLRAPILYPNAFYCAAANYRDHMRAMAVRLNQPDEPDPHELDIKPFHFVLPGRTCTAGPSDPIRLPSHGRNIDWEIELAAVIGRPAKNVSVERALDHVAAYTIGNDVSVRDMNYLKIPNVSSQSLFRNDFIAMKGFDQSCTIGPWLTPARDIPDPQNLSLELWVGDEIMQESSTAQMVFSVAEQIAYLSSRVTLLPGDVVMTGTPAGTGMERDRFLKAGEMVRMRIEGIGEMTQDVVA